MAINNCSLYARLVHWEIWLDNIQFMCMLDIPKQQSLDIQTSVILYQWAEKYCHWLDSSLQVDQSSTLALDQAI